MQEKIMARVTREYDYESPIAIRPHAPVLKSLISQVARERNVTVSTFMNDLVIDFMLRNGRLEAEAAEHIKTRVYSKRNRKPPTG